MEGVLLIAPAGGVITEDPPGAVGDVPPGEQRNDNQPLDKAGTIMLLKKLAGA